jgi:hypothetical protein
MKKYIIALFLVLSCLHTYAQKAVTPGYQGKRFSFDLTANFFPALDGFTTNHRTFSIDSEEAGASLGAFNTRYEASLSYAIRRRMTLTAEYGIGKTGFEENWLDVSSGSSSYGFYVADFKTVGIALLMHGKRSWGLAPIGPYWGVRVMRTNVSSTLTEVQASGGDAWIKLPKSSGATGPKEHFYNVGLTFGARRILFDKLVLNLGFNTHLAGLFEDYLYLSDLEETYMSYRVKRTYWFNAHAGIGYLF